MSQHGLCGVAIWVAHYKKLQAVSVKEFSSDSVCSQKRSINGNRPIVNLYRCSRNFLPVEHKFSRKIFSVKRVRIVFFSRSSVIWVYKKTSWLNSRCDKAQKNILVLRSCNFAFKSCAKSQHIFLGRTKWRKTLWPKTQHIIFGSSKIPNMFFGSSKVPNMFLVRAKSQICFLVCAKSHKTLSVAQSCKITILSRIVLRTRPG